MPPPSAKVNGLELALQRAWVDAAARRAERDSLGASYRVFDVCAACHQLSAEDQTPRQPAAPAVMSRSAPQGLQERNRFSRFCCRCFDVVRLQSPVGLNSCGSACMCYVDSVHVSTCWSAMRAAHLIVARMSCRKIGGGRPVQRAARDGAPRGQQRPGFGLRRCRQPEPQHPEPRRRAAGVACFAHTNDIPFISCYMTFGQIARYTPNTKALLFLSPSNFLRFSLIEISRNNPVQIWPAC